VPSFRSFGKTRLCRKNVEWKHPRSYRFSVLPCNDPLERVCTESARGQVPSGLDASAALLRDPRRAFPLGLECIERSLDMFRGDPPSLEIVADQGVAGATGGELLRPRAGEALVVDVADPLERLERLLPLRRADAVPLETSSELGGRAVAEAQRPERLLDGVRLLRHGGFPSRLGRRGGFLLLLLLFLLDLVDHRGDLLGAGDGR
jgi:hypothetical protein